MKRHIYALLCLLVFIPATLPAETPPTETSKETPLVYVMPIEGMIERGLLYVIRRGVTEALRENADAIIFEMDTPGGRVDVTEEIIRSLIDLPETVETYTFINKDALSAGALIATATRHIYMAPGSRIGASAIVSATGDVEEGDLKEKHVSALTALVRSATERNNHDAKLIECMIRKDLKYEIEGDVICEEGRLLTLTDLDAAKIVKRDDTEAPLLSDGTVNSLAELLEQIDLADSEIRKIQITTAERVARWIELFGFLFLAGGLLGIYIEFKTPGFGVPGVTGIVLLAIFFWGHHIAGLTGGAEILIFALGLLLLALEIFVIPGFGVTGITGITLIMLSLFMAMVEHYPGTDWFEPPQIHMKDALMQLGLGLAMALALGLVVARFLPRTSAFQSLMLSSELDHEHGVTASAPTDSLLGATGKALTPLHPAGFGSFDGKRLNVVARGAFIDPGTPIVVAETHGNRIVVDVDRSATATPENKEPGVPS
jgi:membrane-bound serine protease (ClpP class)